jgi:hypothetical protein
MWDIAAREYGKYSMGGLQKLRGEGRSRKHTLTKYFFKNKIAKDGTSSELNTQRREEERDAYKFLGRRRGEKNPLEYLYIDGSIILKCEENGCEYLE